MPNLQRKNHQKERHYTVMVSGSPRKRSKNGGLAVLVMENPLGNERQNADVPRWQVLAHAKKHSDFPCLFTSFISKWWQQPYKSGSIEVRGILREAQGPENQAKTILNFRDNEKH